MEKFNINSYIAKAARKLKKESGILSIPARKLGRTLPSRVIDTVKQFYHNDEFSRMCPGMKDFITVREGIGKVQP